MILGPASVILLGLSVDQGQTYGHVQVVVYLRERPPVVRFYRAKVGGVGPMSAADSVRLMRLHANLEAAAITGEPTTTMVRDAFLVPVWWDHGNARETWLRGFAAQAPELFDPPAHMPVARVSA